MSELISGKEALDAWYEGLEIEIKHSSTGWFVFNDHNFGITVFKSEDHQFRLKPRTISINGIEVPAPFKPEEDMVVFILDDSKTDGYKKYYFEVAGDNELVFFGVWRTEEEIKQVVAALRQVFKGG